MVSKNDKKHIPSFDKEAGDKVSMCLVSIISVHMLIMNLVSRGLDPYFQCFCVYILPMAITVCEGEGATRRVNRLYDKFQLMFVF